MNLSLFLSRTSILLLLSFPGAIHQANAQLNMKKAGGFKHAIYNRQAENITDQTSQSQLRGLVTGESASMLPNLTVLLREMSIFLFALDGTTNVVARAPECLFNMRSNMAASTNELRVEAGQGQLLISGRGFLCNLTNLHLILSNDVRTTIHGSLLTSARDTRLLTPEAALNARAATDPATTNPPVFINSDQLTLLALSNIVTYEGAVRVDTEQMELTCQTLVIRRATNGTIQEITATGDVVIRSKQGAGTVYGDRAIYTTGQGVELVTLFGAPVRWEDELRQGEAQRVELDLDNNTLQAEHRAWVQLPIQTLQEADWVLSAPNKKSEQSTNQTVIISAELLSVYFPTPNRPGRSVQAQTNVLILNQADQSRASADLAFYAETTGTIELSGHALWSSADRLIQAQNLFLDRTNNFFRAGGEAYLRLPLAAFGRQGALRELNSSSLFATNGTAGALEVNCNRYWYQDGVLHFDRDVRASLLETNRVIAKLRCQSLAVHGSNRLDQVFAEHEVHLEQLPVTLPNGNTVRRWLDCEWMSLLVSTNGQLERIIAQTNVLGGKYETRPDQPEPIMTYLGAQVVTAAFMPGTNQLRRILAERDVMLSQGNRKADGQEAIYDGEKELLTLTGNPTLEAPEGKITEAAAIVYDVAANKFYAVQAVAEGDQLPLLKTRTSPP